MKNKLMRLVELIQEDCPENLIEAFADPDNKNPAAHLDLVSRAIDAHQVRAEKLWRAAGKQRTEAERAASARADLAAFLFAYLTGEPDEYADSAREALAALGRHAELDLVQLLARRR
ncbi:MAG: hypothetical protein C0624_09955 [Desulfuromonas sp.]|nr:MAG: hypothetical protein C0624_09955 [Desulfuromonas sp.]